MNKRLTLTVEDMALLKQLIDAAEKDARYSSDTTKLTVKQRLEQLRYKVTEQ